MPTRHRDYARPPLVAVSTVLVVSALLVGGGSANGSGPAVELPDKVLSHFLCYNRVRGAVLDPVLDVQLTDQFGSTRAAEAFGALQLCNPVKKKRGRQVTRIVDPDQHLTTYFIHESPFVPGTRDVLVTNQFGADQRLTIRNLPELILVPTRKSRHAPPVGLDHFLCYPVFEGKTIGRRVKLKDQFGRYRTKVRRPVEHCNPTEKSHPPAPPTLIQHPDVHLVCYLIKRRRFDPPEVRRTVSQFGRARFKTKVARTLCVPSMKALVP